MPTYTAALIPTNAAFLQHLALHPDNLMHVQGSAIPFIPNKAAGLIRCGIGDVTEALPEAVIEALHAAELLTADELYTLEDMCCDVMELETTTAGGILTMDMAQTHPIITKACKLAGLSARIGSDVAFARQVRKRYL